jgi:hypothetical protein
LLAADVSRLIFISERNYVRGYGLGLRFAFANGEMRLPMGDASKNSKLFGILVAFFQRHRRCLKYFMAKNQSASVRGDAGKEIHPRGKITQSVVTPDDVEQRARELALISGREPNQVSASDRIQAKKELLGDDSANNAVDENEITGRGMGAPPVSRGKKIEPQLPDDDLDEERTVQEGVDEAEHSEMLEASKHPTKNEE